jgi:hypothetical protein
VRELKHDCRTDATRGARGFRKSENVTKFTKRTSENPKPHIEEDGK